jgi:multiple sugar transport system substrate-binding protein
MRRIVASCLLVAAACAGGDGDAQGSITVQLAGEQEEIVIYEALVEAFEQQHADIEVRLVPVADKDDHLTKLTTSFAVGRPPDVFLVNFREYSQFVARGAVAPIESLLEDAGPDLADYYEPPLEAFTYDGRLQCMPQNISSLAVYYNVDLFEAAGLRHPRGWTWNEFRSAAAALTRGDVDGVGIEPNIIRIAPFVWSNGGEIVDDESQPSRFTLEQPAAREALEFIVSLVRDGFVPTAEEVAAQELETRFATGKLGMLLSSRRETPAFREVAGLNFDVAPLPVAKEPAGILHSDAYCISKGSDAIDSAVEFIRFATGGDGQQITAIGGRTVPVLKSVAKSVAFLDPLRAPEHPDVFLEVIPNIRRTPVISTWPEIEDRAEVILTRLFYESGYTMEDALKGLDAQTRELFEEAGA